ncbi:MAG: Jag N-terminal domain-containing protein [Chloroflexi bacterium]|nr:Jag N-terminal domain-containing protein [Chloroflexota bacterium]
MSGTRSVETSAPDIETAIEQGLQQLGVSRESVIVEIIEEPSRGLLGIGARQARVRLTTAAPARSVAPPPPTEAPRPAPERRAAPERRPAPERKAPEVQTTLEVDHDEDDGDLVFGDLEAVSEEDLDEDARMGKATLEELLSKMHIQAKVSAYHAEAEPGEDAPWVLQITGRDLGVLIGRKGETLSALQYITRLIASRELQRRANIVIDVEGYKTRREEMLRKLAKRMADQAIQTGRTVALEPMPPHERRIVHLALRDHPQVITQSIGEGEHRKITIVPNRR